MKDDKTYLAHILEAIEKIKSYLADVSFEQFADNEMMVDAIVRELEIIGEASNNLSDDFHVKYPDVSFRDATDMRNFLVHEYFAVNKKVVWETCKGNLPKLKKFITQIPD